MPDESPKDFLKRKKIGQGEYWLLVRYLERHDRASLSGYVTRTSHREVHEWSTELELRFDPDVDDDVTVTNLEHLVDALQADMQEMLVRINKKIYRDLQEEYEHQTSDEQVLDALDANERYFDQDGDAVEMSDFVRVDQLPPPIQSKVIQRYYNLFAKEPDEIVKALVKADLRFDKRGNQIDTSEYKLVRDLPPDVQEKVIDEHRDWNVEAGYDWWENVYEDWTRRLEELGFNDVEISFSGFSSQGDGASFTAKSIDVLQYLKTIEKSKILEAQAGQIVNRLLGACDAT